TWQMDSYGPDNPHGLIANSSVDEETASAVVIFPTPLKYGETLGMPYAELLRRFAAAIVRPQSTLFVIGYGFNYDHVNTIILEALAVPSFTLVVVDPSPSSDFVNRLKGLNDHRIWLLSGSELGRFSGFVDNVLPDLVDENVRQQIMATHRALRAPGITPEVPADD
ncbi:MAG: hypothetical protein AB1649_32460, partial [Chloroflexota bacterium]